MKKMSIPYTIKQAATELGISTKTLRRWEARGFLVPERQEVSGVRLYHPYLIDYWKKLLELRRAISAHLKKWDDVKNAIDKHTAEQNYVPGQPLKLLTEQELDEFMAARAAEEKWIHDYDKLIKGIQDFPIVMRKASSDLSEEAL